MTVEEFFAGWEESRQIFDVLRTAADAAGAYDLVVTKSQVAFRRRPKASNLSHHKEREL